MKRVYELEFGIDKQRKTPEEERAAVFEFKPIMDTRSGMGYEAYLKEYLELEIFKYTGEKFEEFYSKPSWMSRLMVKTVKAYAKSQEPSKPPDFS